MQGPPPIRTFHARHGRMGAEAWRTLDEIGPRHDPARRVPGRPLVMEIGCGFGDAAVGYARTHPGTDVLAVDVHRPGIVALLRRLDATTDVTNVWVARADALELLFGTGADRLDLGDLVAVHAFFPDPWPKTRHHKRRLVRPDVVDRLAALLPVGGAVRVATDVDHYAVQARRVLDDHPAFVGGPVDRPSWRPRHGYELKADEAGRPVTNLEYHRVSGGT